MQRTATVATNSDVKSNIAMPSTPSPLHHGSLTRIRRAWRRASFWGRRTLINSCLLYTSRDCNGEYIGVFSKIEPILKDIQKAYSPRFAANLERLIDLTPDGRQQSATQRERMKAIREKMPKAK